MPDKAKFVIEERPRSEVFVTEHGYIGIRQDNRGDETTILFTPAEAEDIAAFLKKCVEQVRAKGIRPS